MTYSKMLADYYSVKKDLPSWRLGQHICNTLGLRETIVRGKDLFYADDETAKVLFMDLCDQYHWDLEDLPVISTANL